ncbi:MAG: restriction endonuclease subunit S [Flavobacteriales bacterium]|nr:restriction endonuclease subunit S [Flavobacteriales bacterium]
MPTATKKPNPSSNGSSVDKAPQPGAKPGYKHTKLGWLPEEWEVKRIRELFEVKGRVGWKGYTQADLRSSGPIAIGGKHIDEQHRLKLSDPTHLSQEKYDESPEIMVQVGDMLLTQRGTLGRVALVSTDIGPATINPSLVILRPRTEVCSEFVHAFLTSSGQEKQMLIEVASTGVPMLSQKQIGDFRLPIPGLKERKRIAEVLGAWDRAIATVQQLLAAQQERKCGLMQVLLEEVYHRCKKVSIGSIAEESTDRHTTTADHIVLSCSKYHGFVSSLEYFKKQVYSEDRSNYKVIRRGQFGFPANHIEEGSIDLLTTHDIGLISPIYVVFEFDHATVNSEFMYYLFKTDRYRYIFKNSTNSSVDRRGSLRWNDFKNLWVPLPGREEQDRLAKLFQHMDHQIEYTEEYLTHLTSQKRGLMQVLLTGEKRLTTEAA